MMQYRETIPVEEQDAIWAEARKPFIRYQTHESEGNLHVIIICAHLSFVNVSGFFKIVRFQVGDELEDRDKDMRKVAAKRAYAKPKRRT